MIPDNHRLKICNARLLLDNVLAELPLKFFISCISGTESNDKSKGAAASSTHEFRANVAFFIVYSKGVITEDEIFQKFDKVTTDIDFEINSLASRSTDEKEAIFSKLKQTVKIKFDFF